MNNKKKILKDLKDRFSRCGERIYVVPSHELFEELWLKNSSPDLMKEARELNVPEHFLMNFYRESNEDMVYRFERVLDYWDSFASMDFSVVGEGTGGYTCDRMHYICIKENESLIHRQPTRDERVLFLEARRITYEKLGIEDAYRSIIKLNLWNEFDKFVKEELAKSNIEYFYEVYSFQIFKKLD